MVRTSASAVRPAVVVLAVLLLVVVMVPFPSAAPPSGACMGMSKPGRGLRHRDVQNFFSLGGHGEIHDPRAEQPALPGAVGRTHPRAAGGLRARPSRADPGTVGVR